MEFKHPKYYKELRKAGNELAQRSAVKEDLASSGSSPARNKSDRPLAVEKLSTLETACALVRATSSKPQAASPKPQAPSLEKNKPQASSPKQQASSFKPQAASSMILEPRKSFTAPEPRCWTMINVLCG